MTVKEVRRKRKPLRKCYYLCTYPKTCIRLESLAKQYELCTCASYVSSETELEKDQTMFSLEPVCCKLIVYQTECSRHSSDYRTAILFNKLLFFFLY